MALAVDDRVIQAEDPIPSGRKFPWFRLIGLAGIVLAIIGIAKADVLKVNGLGIPEVPSPLYYVGVALVLIWTVREIAAPTRRSTFWYALSLFVVVVLLHGLSSLVQTNPRFPVAYIHVGFTDQIATNGKLLPLLDARFSWPSFFAGAGLLQKATGGSEVLWLVRFTPVVVTLIACCGTMILGRITGISVQRCRTAALLFALLNWVGQDYFAPQAVGYVINLAIICTVLLVFPGNGPKPWSRLDRWLRPRTIPQIEVSVRVQRVVLIGLVVAIGVLVTAHQLTPGFLAVSLLLLSVVSATRVKYLAFTTAALTLGWLAYAAEAYWIGHTETIFGSAGNFGVLVQQNIGKRTGGGMDRSVVVASRLGLSGVVMLTIVVACVVLWRRRDLPTPLVMLAIAPVPLLALQSYGGEMLLRVFFFLLPAGCLLIAEAFGGVVGRWRIARQGFTTLVSLAIVPVFLIALYGNESFEQVTPGDRKIIDTLYAQAPDSTVVYLLNTISLEYVQRVNVFRFRTIAVGTTAKEILGRMEGTKNRAGIFVPSQYVMVSNSQEQQGVQLQGLPRGWTGKVVADLLATGHYTLVVRQDDSVLLHFIPPAKKGSK